MKRLLWCVVLLITGIAASAQELRGREDLVSPEILPDNRVVFRIEAPEARSVKVTGDFLPEREDDTDRAVPMTRTEGGVWEYTTPAPLAPELYTYSFVVDGLRTTDPNNAHVFRNVATLYSVFLIEGGRADLYRVNDVPHGTVSYEWYFSPTVGEERRMAVYTPAGYGSSGTKYPVLYLLHGMGGDEGAWLVFGRAAQILDNLIARGLAQPMIVAMPNGNMAQQAAPGESDRGFETPRFVLPHTMDGLMETHFPDVVQHMDNHYRTIRRKEARAIAGLSMGGFHALHISKQYPDLFGYVGLFSAVVMPSDSVQSPVYRHSAEKLAVQFAHVPELYWIGIGRSDFLYGENEAFRRELDAKGYPYTYYESEGDHIWRNWRIYLTEFVPLLFR